MNSDNKYQLNQILKKKISSFYKIYFLISAEIYFKNLAANRVTRVTTVIMFAKSGHARHVNRQENPTSI